MNILLDCDGVLADFPGGVVKAVNQFYSTNWKTSDIKTWDIGQSLGLPTDIIDEIASQPGFCLDLEPYPEALEAVKKLKTLGDVWIVTSPHKSKTWCWERIKWCERHLDISYKRVINASDKRLISGDLFLDDKPANLENWCNDQKGVALLWDQTWNRDFPAIWHPPPVIKGGLITRAKNWQQVLTHAQDIYTEETCSKKVM